MATKEVKIKLTTKGAAKAKQQLGGVEKSIGLLAKSAITLAAAYKVTQFAFEALKLAGKLRDLETAHKNLAKAQGLNAKVMIDEMQKATRGTVSELDLLQQANNALLLGLPLAEGDMGRLADAGRRLGRAMGIDAAMGLESLVVGIGRGSKLWLDNLGIIVDTNKAYQKHAKIINKQASALTDAEKKLAFYNETMESVDLKMKTLGADQVTVTDRIEQGNVAFERAKIAMGKIIEEPYAEAMGAFAKSTEVFEKSVGKSGLWGALVGLLTPMKTGRKLAKEYMKELDDIAKAQEKRDAKKTEGMSEKEIAIAQALALQKKMEADELRKIAEIQDKILLNQANRLLNEKAMLELKQQGKVPWTEEELLQQRIAEGAKKEFEIRGLTKIETLNILRVTKQQIIQEKLLRHARGLVNLEVGKNVTISKDINSITFDNIQATKNLVAQLARGVELFRGMDKFGQSLLNSVQRTAEQLAGKAFTAFLMSFIPGSGGFVSSLKGLLGFQHGGPVEANQPIIVGEKRPEVFIPDRPGTILPEVGGGNTLNIYIQSPFVGNIDEFAEEVANRSDQGFNRITVDA